MKIEMTDGRTLIGMHLLYSLEKALEDQHILVFHGALLPIVIM